MSDEKNNAQLGAGAAAAGAADGGEKDVLLSVEHLHKAYGDHVVLDDISLEVKRGEVIVIIGPSGCGKSTFLRCLNALEPIQGGSVKVAGKSVDADERGLVELRQKVGMVFQSYDLFPHMTVLDNITLAPMKARGVAREEAEAQARALLERVGLADKASSYPRQLSGGQKQRVAIAGVIAMQPKCIVLDEPTAMLDPAGRREVIDTATKLCREQGITVVLITHHMEECIGADRVIVLSNGAVVADGAPKQVFSQVDLLKREGLTAPVTVRLLHALRAHGMDVPLDALTVSDCADAVAAALKP